MASSPYVLLFPFSICTQSNLKTNFLDQINCTPVAKSIVNKQQNRSMKMRKVIIAIALMFSSSSYAASDYHGYVGAQLGQVTIDIDDISDDIEPIVGLLRLGIFFTDNFAVEGRLGGTIDEDEVQGIDIRVESMAGLYALYRVSFNEDAYVYGLGGYTDVKLKGDVPGPDLEESEQGFSYGAGINVYGFTLEWVRYLDKSDVTADAATIGYVYEFK
jgi:hypothetical protein